MKKESEKDIAQDILDLCNSISARLDNCIGSLNQISEGMAAIDRKRKPCGVKGCC